MGTTDATHACELGSLGPGKVPAGRETFLCRGGFARAGSPRRDQPPRGADAWQVFGLHFMFLICLFRCSG